MGWVSRQRPAYQVLLFIGVLGTAILMVNTGISWLGGFEQTYGVLSHWLGWASKGYVDRVMTDHKVEHKVEIGKVLSAVSDVQSEQLFDRIGRLERQLTEMNRNPHQTWLEQEQVRKTQDELSRVKSKYAQLQRQP